MTVERGSLREEGGAAVVRFHFNPTALSWTRSATFNREASQGSLTEPPAQFTGLQATQVQVELLFDALGSGSPHGVQPEIDQLVAWTRLPEGASTQSASPPKLLLTWGRLKIVDSTAFRCHLEQLRVTVEMFARDGVPLRAKTALTLKSAATEPAGTNPTSGTERAHRRRVLRSGQTLQALAQAEYGDPGVWRTIAEINGIDDPTRLRPETEVLLPDPSNVAGARR